MSQSDLNIAILGAGLAGLSTSYHLGHPANAVILEAKDHYGGHVYSDERDGFTWDDGPHISFTMNQYVKDLFAEFVDGEYEELKIQAVNYFQGHWIDHPAQTCLYQVPEPLRTQCLESFLETARRPSTTTPEELRGVAAPGDGPGLRRHLPGCVHTEVLDHRAAEPRRRLDRAAHPAPGGRRRRQRARRARFRRRCTTSTTRSPRYPSKGGFLSYCHKMADGADIRYNTKIDQIDFGKRILRFDRRHRAELRAARLDHPAAVSHQSLDRRARRRPGSRVVAPLHAVLPNRRRREPPAPARRDLVLRLRRGQAQRAHQRHGALRAEQRPDRQDRHPGRGVRLGLEAAAARPREGEAAGRRASCSRWGSSTTPDAIESAHDRGSCPPVRSSTTSSAARSLARREQLPRQHGRAPRRPVLRVEVPDERRVRARRPSRPRSGSASKSDDTDWDGVAITDDDVPGRRSREPRRASGQPRDG